MTTQPYEDGVISIDGELYQTLGPAQQFLASRQPGKVTFGDYTEASNPFASEFSLGDFRDGIGVNRGSLPDDAKRVWFATTQLRYADSTILPRKAIQTAAGPAADAQTLTIFKNEVYGTYLTAVHVYSNSSDTWGSSLRTLADTATDAKVGLLGTTETLVIANGTDVDYATSSSVWAENTGQAIKYIVFWSDLLWGITNAGQMYFTNDLATAWSADAQLPLPSGAIKGLIVARGPDREQHIYAVTNQGLFVHDAPNARFLPTDLQLPEHPDGGKGHEVWRGKLFTSAGNAIYGFQAGSDQTLVQVVGPDLDDGLPYNRRGVVNILLKSHNDLLAMLDASTFSGVSALKTRVSRGVRFHHGVTFPVSSGFSAILGWNERGWEVKWTSGNNARGVTAGEVGVAYSQYRLWWAVNQRVYWMSIPLDVTNPLQVPATTYESTGTLETPWFDMGIRNQHKLAISVIVDSIHPTATETILIEYATNYVETYTTLATKDSTGEVKYRLPNGVNKEGVPFRAWKYRVTLSRGSTTTATPQLIRLTLAWRPRIKVLWAIRATIDLKHEDGHAGVMNVAKLEQLKKSTQAGVLIPVSYKAGNDSTLTYMMDALDLQINDEPGTDTYGTVNVVFAEPEPTFEDEA